MKRERISIPVVITIDSKHKIKVYKSKCNISNVNIKRLAIFMNEYAHFSNFRRHISGKPDRRGRFSFSKLFSSFFIQDNDRMYYSKRNQAIFERMDLRKLYISPRKKSSTKSYLIALRINSNNYLLSSVRGFSIITRPDYFRKMPK